MTEKTNILKFEAKEDFSVAFCEAFNGKTLSHHSVLLNSQLQFFIWPTWECITRYGAEVRIPLEITKSHADAVEFFEPLRNEARLLHLMFSMEVAQTDQGLEKLNGKHDFPFYSANLRYHSSHPNRGRPLSINYRFSTHPRHTYCFDQMEAIRFASFRGGSISKFVERMWAKSMHPHVSILVKAKNNCLLHMNCLPNGDKDTKFGLFYYTRVHASKLMIGETFVEAPNLLGERLLILNGPLREVTRCTEELTKTGEYEICFESGLEQEFLPLEGTFGSDVCVQMTLTDSAGKKIRSQYRHNTIVDICIALFFMDTPYEVLEIVDKLPLLSYANRVEKVLLIESVFQSMRKVVQQRKFIINE